MIIISDTTPKKTAVLKYIVSKPPSAKVFSWSE